MKNFYTLNAGEWFVAEELARQRPDLELYYPIKDRGVDLLAVARDGSQSRRIQIKESRIYAGKDHSWHQIRPEKIDDADFFVFITYVPVVKKARAAFENDYAVIPRSELRRLCGGKKCSQGKFSFYFRLAEGRLQEIRDGNRDVTKFHRAWHLI